MAEKEYFTADIRDGKLVFYGDEATRVADLLKLTARRKDGLSFFHFPEHSVYCAFVLEWNEIGIRISEVDRWSIHDSITRFFSDPKNRNLWVREDRVLAALAEHPESVVLDCLATKRDGLLRKTRSKQTFYAAGRSILEQESVPVGDGRFLSRATKLLRQSGPMYKSRLTARLGGAHANDPLNVLIEQGAIKSTREECLYGRPGLVVYLPGQEPEFDSRGKLTS